MVNPVGPRMLPEPKVLVVIPAFNEEESIEGVVREVQSCQPKFDISVGSRFLHNGNSKPPFVRNIGIHFFSWLTSKMASQRITDCSSGFRALNRRSFEYFADSYPIDFPDAEALIAAHRAGLRVFETPVKFRTRNSGSSSLRTWRMVYYPIREVFSIVMMGTRKRDSL